MGVRHPGGIEVDRRDIQRLFDPVGVVEQAIIGGVGNHRMNRPLCLRGGSDFLFDAVASKFTARDPTKNPQRITRRFQPDWHYIVHHQQMRQRFMTIAVDQQRTAGWRGVHTHNFVRRRCSVGNDITLFRVKSPRDVLFCFQVWPGVVEQRTKLGDRNRDISLEGIPAEKIIKQAANRAFLICGAAHMPRRTKGVLPLFNVGKQGFRERRCNVIKIFVGVLTHTNGDIFRLPQRIFKKPERHPHILHADIHRRVGVDEGIKREIFIKLIDIAA